jgi:hypothetical protein
MTRSLHRLVIIGCLLLACARPAVASAEADTLHHTIPAWPIVYYRTEGDVVKTDILFSMIYYERQKSLTRYAFRPFLFSTEGDPEKDYRKTSLLWPLVRFGSCPATRTSKTGSYWAILGGLIGRETSPDGQSRMRWL